MHTSPSLAPLALAALTIARAILANLQRLDGAEDAGAKGLRAMVREGRPFAAAESARTLRDALLARTWRAEDLADALDGQQGEVVPCDPRLVVASLALACDALAGACDAPRPRARALKLNRAAAALDACVGAVSVDPTTRRVIAAGVEAPDASPAGYALGALAG